jgi:hypothetical protein
VLKQTIVWTALPNGVDGPVIEGSTLRISVLASPRLWNDDPTVSKMHLNDFPDFLDWPAMIEPAGFEVEFAGAPALAGTADTTPLQSTLWAALFKPTTDVVPFVFEDLSGSEILSFSAGQVHETVKGVYQQAATDPAYGAGINHPTKETLANDDDLVEIARPVHAEPPFEPRDPDRGPVIIERPPGAPGTGSGTGTGPGSSPGKGPFDGCLGCLGSLILLPLLLVVAVSQRALRLFRLMAVLPVLAMLGSQRVSARLSPNGGGGGGMAPSSAKKAAFDQLNEYVAPTSPDSEDLQTSAEIAETFDFHRMIAALGDYPRLLRHMGLVVDLTVIVPAGGLPATGTIRVIPNLSLASATTNHSPRTHYELDAGRFLATPRTPNADLANGLVRLQDGDRFQVHQIDVVGSGIKLQNMATNLVGLQSLNEVPVNSPNEDGLPALQTAGIAVIRPDAPAYLRHRFRRSYALNAALAAIDLSPLQPFASGEPAPAADDELFAEDVIRGFRLDVRDDHANRWLSLCRRVGTYEFLEAAGGGPPLVEEDEGFVQIGATEAVKPGTSRVLRAHESLFAWDGWSLVAPRPGDAIRPDGVDHGEIENPPATPFKLQATFKARPASLPRLRFGYKYRLRARLVDLAGNSVFDPDRPAFDTSQAEITPEFMFRRFEPVGPPPVMLRTVPKEGESLERLTIRSAVQDLAAAIALQTTDRHITPTKIAQLMAERHGRFDGTSTMNKDAAAYDLASTEAGSLTHRLDMATDSLDLIPGVSEVTEPTENRTYWLQANDTFDVRYLPDPYARGVLFLGLPGMAGPEVVAPLFNRIPFGGAWPNLEPFRLRVQGLPAGGSPAAPAWDAATHQLTVQLAQGETATVRMASYLDPSDLPTMGVWAWTEDAAPADLASLKAATVDGRNWLHLPFRTLTLVHAVQQPLAIPEVAVLAVDPLRKVGETAVSLKGNLAVDAKSTGKVDLWAEWKDPRDDPADPTNDPTIDVDWQRTHVRELTLPDPKDDTPSLTGILRAMGDKAGDPGDLVQGLRHAVGDTKYHSVVYTPIASTRFRENFAPGLSAADLTRPLPAEVPKPTTLAVPNAARPDAPRPLYVLPTFRWTQAEVGGVRTRQRRGGGLRIYLERPWFSSGAGELLGAVLRPDAVGPTSETADMLRKYISEWGMDPLWNAAKTAPLRVGDLLNATSTKAGLSLAELSGAPPPTVDVAGFEVGYDATRKLWFSDIEMRVDQSYFPFVRLTLARYQPNSVDGAHLSRVVLSDFVQVLPHRTVEYDLNGAVANGVVPIRVLGPSQHVTDGPGFGATMVVARLERRQFGDAADTEPMGWEAIDSIILEASSAGGFNMVWRGDMPLPGPLPTPLRISILEAQILRTDGRPIEDPFELLQGRHMSGVSPTTFAGPNMAEAPPLGYRIVFVDTTEVIQL